MLRAATRIVSTQTKACYINNCRRFTFFAGKIEDSTHFSQEDKINSALSTGKVKDAETGYYKGLGFFKLGEGYELDAIEAFTAAIKLDENKNYTAESQYYLDILKEGHSPNSLIRRT